MKKRFFALLTAVCIALTTGLTTGLTALADGGENSDMTIGMSTQEQCSCTTLCTEGNINPDCPVCGAEGADLTACKGAPLMMRAAPLAAGNDRPHSLYVGNTNFASTIYPDNAAYWTSSDGGTNWTSQLEKPTGDSYIHYNGQGTLTLHNANIQGQYDSSNRYSGYGIYAVGAPGNAVSLTIKLEGTNTVSGWSGIFVHAVDGAASLSISGTGSLATEGTGGISFSGIVVQGNGGKAELTINNVDVTATNTSDSAQGILLQSADSSPATLTVNGGELTASGQRAGIKYVFGSSGTGDGTPTVTVSGNAIVRANGGISDDSSTDIQIGADSSASSGGIVFDGKNGTVYGAVTLQEDITIGEGESLTLDDGASLNAGNYNVIVDGGTLDENLANSLGDSVKYAPTITTTTLPNGTVDTEYKQILTATGNNITWSSDDLPEWLTLDNSTGVITGTPTTADTYNFTVTAENSAGSDEKTFTLTIGVAPVYSITAEPLKLDFGTLTEGYTPASQTVTITNNGNQPLTLNQPASTGHFEVGNLSTLTLPANGTATFTVQPKAGLAAGTYSENIDVTASNNVTLSIPASLTVQKASVPTKPEVPSTGTTSGGSTGESTYPDVEDAQTSYEQATRDFWNRTINKIKKADEGDSLRIYIGIHEEIPGDVIQAIRENGVNVTFYNQDGDEVTVYAESAPTKYQAVWTLKQLGNYVLTEQQTPAAQEESPAAQQPADEPTTPTQPAETEAVDTAKPNPSTGEGSGAVIAMIAAAAALAGLGATLRKR